MTLADHLTHAKYIRSLLVAFMVANFNEANSNLLRHALETDDLEACT